MSGNALLLMTGSRAARSGGGDGFLSRLVHRVPGGGGLTRRRCGQKTRMPIPRIVGRWNKAGLNRITRHIAPWAPGLGVVVHRGRRSGRRYQTPVNVFPAGDGYVFALTYGPDTDWVRNVLAAGGCERHTRGHVIQLVSPRLFHDPARRGIRPVERRVLRILGVADFLSLQATGSAPAAPSHA